jgi:hypothetical protein
VGGKGPIQKSSRRGGTKFKSSKHKSYFANSNSSCFSGAKPLGDQGKDLLPWSNVIGENTNKSKAQSLLLFLAVPLF